jgi:hypothetical protein
MCSFSGSKNDLYRAAVTTDPEFGVGTRTAGTGAGLIVAGKLYHSNLDSDDRLNY